MSDARSQGVQIHAYREVLVYSQHIFAGSEWQFHHRAFCTNYSRSPTATRARGESRPSVRPSSLPSLVRQPAQSSSCLPPQTAMPSWLPRSSKGNETAHRIAILKTELRLILCTANRLNMQFLVRIEGNQKIAPRFLAHMKYGMSSPRICPP